MEAGRQVDHPGGRRRAEDRLDVQAGRADDLLGDRADPVLAGDPSPAAPATRTRITPIGAAVLPPA